MGLPEINNCPGTLAPGFHTYSKTCLNRVFHGKKVDHILPYETPAASSGTDDRFLENRKRMSISGVQEKFSMLLQKNKLRLTNEGEQGGYILKPVPGAGKKPHLMPANEHLTMQIARQVYHIETAENALIFFEKGQPAYIAKRFDVKKDGSKRAQEDFASLAGRTPQTHGGQYKYQGNYLELFQLMKKYVPAYTLEAPKLLKLLLFNYLFSNGDAHVKNFSLLETDWGDYRLSPAYDLLNSRIHIEDRDFALEDGLLPRNLAQGEIGEQFGVLAKEAEIDEHIYEELYVSMLAASSQVEKLIAASFLDATTKRSYLQSYQSRIKQLKK